MIGVPSEIPAEASAVIVRRASLDLRHDDAHVRVIVAILTTDPCIGALV